MYLDFLKRGRMINRVVRGRKKRDQISKTMMTKTSKIVAIKTKIAAKTMVKMTAITAMITTTTIMIIITMVKVVLMTGKIFQVTC